MLNPSRYAFVLQNPHTQVQNALHSLCSTQSCQEASTQNSLLNPSLTRHALPAVNSGQENRFDLDRAPCRQEKYSRGMPCHSLSDTLAYDIAHQDTSTPNKCTLVSPASQQLSLARQMALLPPAACHQVPYESTCHYKYFDRKCQAARELTSYLHQ